MGRVSKELVGASASSIILSILAKKDSYGYEIMAKVKELSNGQIIWQEGSLYPVLHKLEKSGLIKSVWKMADNGRHRRYYVINKKGTTQLQAEIKSWLMMKNMMETLWAEASIVVEEK